MDGTEDVILVTQNGILLRTPSEAIRQTGRASQGVIVMRFKEEGDKVIALADIAMYTDEEEVPLRQVLNSIKEQEQGKAVSSVDVKTASKDELFQFMGQVLPTFDRDRVHPSDVKKLIQWYNILVTNGITDFEEKTPETGEEKAGEE